VIRVAAVADVHFGTESHGMLRPKLEHLRERADLLLIGGDLTRCGGPAEAQVLADELRGLPVPVVAVLGNHDYEANREAEVRVRLESAGVRVLEGEGVTLQINGLRVGIAGTKGFGGGFRGAHGSDFGEPEMKAFVGHTKLLADRLGKSLAALDTDLRIALLHYSPVEETLVGERLEIYPFLGSYLLAEAIDGAGADLVLHGHAHRGTERGQTPGGIPVRNVAQPVIEHAYNVYTLEPHRNGLAAASGGELRFPHGSGAADRSLLPRGGLRPN
jgi:Icc-related predicted phosphoesterase